MCGRGFLGVIITCSLLVFLMAACEKGENAAVVSHDMKSDHVTTADSLDIYYSYGGAGETALVFVHGWGCDRNYWKKQVNYFIKHFTVVTVDLAGHGQSGLNRHAWTIPAFGTDVAAVVENLKLNRVILIGHSMGGPAVVEAARLLPGKVLGIIGIDTFQDFVEKMDETDFKIWISDFERNFPGATTNFVRSMFMPYADTAIINTVAADMSLEPPEVGIGAFYGYYDYDIMPAIRELDIPIRCINANLWPTNIAGNKEVEPLYDVVFIDSVGHFPQLVKPIEFNEKLAATIEDIIAHKKRL